MNKRWFRTLFRRRILISLLIVLQAALVVWFIVSTSQVSVVVRHILHIISFVAVLAIVAKKDKGAFKTTWVFLILSLPVLGGLMYILMHIQSPTRKMKTELKKAEEKAAGLYAYPGTDYAAAETEMAEHFPQVRYLQNYVGFPVYGNTATKYFSPGEDMLEALLPELEKHFPGTLKGIDRAITALEADTDFINGFVSAIPEQNRTSIAFWRQQHDAVRIRLLRDLTGTIPTHDLLERVNHELEKISGELRRIPAGQGIEIHLRNDMICKGPSRRLPPQPFFWEWQKTAAVTRGIWHFSVSEVPAVEYGTADSAIFDADKLPGILEIGSPLPGDRMIPFGSRTAAKIKKLRIDRHISPERSLPVMRAGKEICWAPMIRNSAVAVVTEKTARIVKFNFREID